MVTQTYTTYIHTTPERLWDALTMPEQTVRYLTSWQWSPRGFLAPR